MNHPLVSVIIPNYNHAPFLKERIDSVLSQTYDNIEVIILDDKSTDHSVGIINEYRHHPKVKEIVLNEENSGCTFIQWQRGFSMSEGEWIWIAESDDVAHPDFLKRLVESVSEKPDAVLALSGIQIIDEHNNKGNCLWASKTKRVIARKGKDFIRRSLYLGNHLYNASSTIIRRSVLSDIPGDYMRLGASGDYLFYIELAMRGDVVEVPEALDYFRRHSSTVTPRLYSSGVAFENAHKIYRRLRALGFCNGLYRYVLVGFRLCQIDNNKRFNSHEIKSRLHRLWAAEVSSSVLAKICYMAYAPVKRLYSTLWK